MSFPADPIDSAESLLGSPVFERLQISTEDLDRSAYYAAERERKSAFQASQSLEGFLESLEMRVERVDPSPMTVPRIAQLTQKTNQFNLTTRRYSEQEISETSLDPSKKVVAVRVQDRFGDNGIVGVAIASIDGGACRIESFLLSCRVIGRGVETALLGLLIQAIERLGVATVTGLFIPTKKNAPARDFYPKHGFERTSMTSTSDETVWALDLGSKTISIPDWIEIAPTLTSPSGS